MKDTSDYKAGDVISVRMGASDRRRLVRVTERYDNVKNDYPGFSGITTKGCTDGTAAGASVWGYDSQVDAIISRRENDDPFRGLTS